MIKPHRATLFGEYAARWQHNEIRRSVGRVRGDKPQITNWNQAWLDCSAGLQNTSFCQDTSTQKWTVADVPQTFWVKTSSCILSVRNCREIQLLYLISSSQQRWHCTQQQANRSGGLVPMQTRSWHSDDASPAPCCTAGSCRGLLEDCRQWRRGACRELLPGNLPRRTLNGLQIMDNIQRHHSSSHLAIAKSWWALPDAPPLFRALTGCDIVLALFRLEKNSMECMAFGDHGHSRHHHTKPIQPQHWLTSHAASRALDCTDVHQELWLTVSEWSKNGHVHTWPEVAGIYSAYTC